MKEIKLPHYSKPLAGEIEAPGDKSISHRAIMFGSIAKGKTVISNFLNSEDCIRTIRAFQAMGVSIQHDGTTVIIEGNGVSNLKEPLEPIYFGNSGTTARLMLGLFAGLPFFSTVFGDPSLTRRPMNRVIDPLKQMGAIIEGRKNGLLLPLSIKGTKLNGIRYTLPVKSAQVKSALLLAGLLAKGRTIITENTPTRDHTENMLKAFGADLERDHHTITITGNHTLTATDVYVPGDISSAAFFLVAAAIVPNSRLTLRNVGLNYTRTGILDILDKMGSEISISNERIIGGEKLGDVTISHQKLKGTTIEGEIIPRLIDEIPIIALLATQAEGKTVIRNAEELKVKETDRIAAVVDVLSTLGANIEATDDGMIIYGGTKLHGGLVSSYNDHRIAMMAAIAALVATDTVIIDDTSSIAISYPAFFEDLTLVTN